MQPNQDDSLDQDARQYLRKLVADMDEGRGSDGASVNSEKRSLWTVIFCGLVIALTLAFSVFVVWLVVLQLR